ncbi:YycH family regulatory protein [Lentibacillus saliphilus]|uniref:YycH family regulatory protein n=1 Tax=Lentibacillus saliphilus TaxID=2737028 RepID=UPI001C2F6199|nr:two-component system activity regulator YycH [Lentibacillus saliphilus]
MNLETIKSIILVMLVGISLLLTFSLWSYQPKDELLINKPLVSEEDMDIKGTQETKRDMVEPIEMIFHNNGALHGFKDPNDRQRIYRDMQTWVLYDFNLRNTASNVQDDQMVEMIFREPIPMRLLNSLFKFNEEPYLPEWSFERIYITFDENTSHMNIRFESTTSGQYALAVVNNSRKFNLLWEYVMTDRDMQPYLKVDGISDPIYVPKDPITMYNWSLTTNAINPNQLVNALFNNPSVVKHNVSDDEIIYTDGQQGMRVDQNKRSMDYYIAYDVNNYELMDPVDLLERSINSVNEHRGWTGDYRFWSFSRHDNELTYRMFYDGYPVFSQQGYSIIQQTWRQNELYQYKRPLFNINNQIGATSMTLPSGKDVIAAIENQQYANYDMNNIRDIRPGYKLVYKDSSMYIMTLEPTWYMEYAGEWVEIKMSNEGLLSLKGGD